MTDLATIRARLEHYTPIEAGKPADARAAVAIVLQPSDRGAEFIVIHRAHRSGDPWSGHMALPGGRQDAADRDLLATAARETREEVAVDLERHAEMLGRLDDLQAIGRGRPMDLIITPFVYALHSAVTLIPNQSEVQSAFWIPLASLRHPEARGVMQHTVSGQDLQHPAFIYQGYTIWGLTHRILTGFLELIA